MLIGIPVKPFGVAKARLSPVLDATQRSRLGKAIAAHTAEVASTIGVASIVTGDAGVARWARGLGLDAIDELAGGLNGAAEAVVKAAAGEPWMFLHADLPRLSTDDLALAVSGLMSTGAVIAPSSDGGTSLIGAVGPVLFSYGPASFHRHLRALPTAAIVVRPGLALDLDTPADYRAWRRGRAIPAGSH